jgi:hypothetical protein
MPSCRALKRAPRRLQSAVDEAIEALKNVKIDLERKQKVRGGAGPVEWGRRRLAAGGSRRRPAPAGGRVSFQQ